MMKDAVRKLIRLGYKKFHGWLPGLHAFEITGQSYWHIPVVHAQELKERIKRHESFVLLDVRSNSEWDSGHLPGAKHIYIGKLLENLQEIDKKTRITTFCDSGQRATIAASLLKQNQFENIEICFGSMAACKEIDCPIEK
jgi:hydroxyacylglutathione hydrolase